MRGGVTPPRKMKGVDKQMAKKKLKSSVKKTLRIILAIASSIAIIYCGYNLFDRGYEIKNSIKASDYVDELLDENGGETSDFTQEDWYKLYQENSDFLAYLKWDSDIISLPVMQGQTDNSYMRTAFNGEYSVEGTPFFESTADVMNDTNIMIYGHSLFYSDTGMFSPITHFIEQDFYENNKTFKLYFENEIRSYEVVTAYQSTTATETYSYVTRNFANEENYNSFVQTMKERNEISSDFELSYGDKTITFQTCKINNSNIKIVVVAKLIEVNSYE